MRLSNLFSNVASHYLSSSLSGHLLSHYNLQLTIFPHFNWDVFPTLGYAVNRSPRSSHHKSHSMLSRQDRQPVRADLVGRITVERHTVCAYNYSEGSIVSLGAT